MNIVGPKSAAAMGGLKVILRRLDCGASVGVGLKLGRRYRAWRFRNPFFRWDERKGGKRP